MSLDQSSITQLILEAKAKAEAEIGTVNAPLPPKDVEWPVNCDVKPGLEGAVAAESKIGSVDGARGALIYRGFDIFDLCAHSNFEEVSYLLIHGNLPTQSELDEFKASLRENQRVLATTARLYQNLPLDTLHPMKLLEVAMIGAQADDAGKKLSDKEVAYRVIAQMMTATGMIARLKKGLKPIDPDPELSHAANLIYCMTGERPTETATRLMDISLILHADHGMNASTFTTMVVASTLADLYFAMSGGLGSLSGPLHGGANEAVLHDLDEIGTPENVEDWFNSARNSKRKIMGMGHRVYKAYDPRARVLRPLAQAFAEINPESAKLFTTAVKLEEKVLDAMGREKKIFPNVDFYSGIVYRGMGIETDMFTPLFAVSRVSGWVARVLEYKENNRIFRPRGIYTGAVNSQYVPIAER